MSDTDSTTEDNHAGENGLTLKEKEELKLKQRDEDRKDKELRHSLYKFIIGTVGLTVISLIVNLIIKNVELNADLLKEEASWFREDLELIDLKKDSTSKESVIKRFEIMLGVVQTDGAKNMYTNGLKLVSETTDTLIDTKSQKQEMEKEEDVLILASTFSDFEKDKIRLEEKISADPTNKTYQDSLKDINKEIAGLLSDDKVKRYDSLDRKIESLESTSFSPDKEPVEKIEIETRNTISKKKDVWLKEGYFRPYMGFQIWIDRLDVKGNKATIALREDGNNPPIQSLECSIGEKIELYGSGTDDDGNPIELEFIIYCTKIDRAGKNPFNKAMYYDIWVNKL